MASTNHTANYNLSQYISSDKPTYLVDYNNDMLAIDTQMKANATAIGVNAANITTAQTTADNAEIHAQSGISNAALAQTAADNANTHIGTLANLETSEKTNLVGAINEVLSYFNLTPTDNVNYNSMTITGGTLTNGEVKTSINNLGNLAKLYGTIVFNKTSDVMTITFNTSLRPATDIIINNEALVRYTSPVLTMPVDVTIKTTGEVEIYTYDSGRGVSAINLLPFLLFIKDFGDTPTPQI